MKEYKDAENGSVLEWIKAHYLSREIRESRSPAGNWLQMTLEHIAKGEAHLSMRVRPEMTNPYGHIHGGMMSLIIDEAVGWAVVSLDAELHYTSLNLNVDFLYGIPEGERLVARARVLRQGKKIIHAEVHVYDMQERLLAKAASNLIVTGMQMR